jgi:crotonobetainyl-CoA:carnitine CoA-transferase CaiB-like acyl-CoA transferase
LLGVPEYGDRQPEIMTGGPPLEKFFDAIKPWLDARDTAEIVETSQAFRVPAAPVGDAQKILDFAQFRERPFFIEEDGTTFPGPPYRLSVTPARRHGPAPRLGATGAAPARAETTRPAVTPEQRDLPYAGVRVVELSNFWAAPICGMYLGALGASVVKIESTRRPDGMRFSGAVPQMGEDWYDRSGVFAATNLNKRELAVELNRAEGREALLRLVAEADVVIENFAARVIEQFSIGYDDLRAVKPDIIMVRMPAFGLEGPWRDYVGWAMVIEQSTGMASVTGWPDLPMHPGGLVDPVNGMHAAVAVQAALDHRDRTGEGQMIEIAQLETGANLAAELVMQWTERGEALSRPGNRDHHVAPQGVYRCVDDDAAAWVALTIESDDQWRALTDAMDRPDWAADRGLASLAGRRDRHDELDEGIGAWTREFAPEKVVELLRARGIPVARVLQVPHTYDEPQLVARGFYYELPHPLSGPRGYPAWPMQFSFLDAPHRSGAPLLGEHNHEVLAELGYSDDEIAALERDGVIGNRMAGG